MPIINNITLYNKVKQLADTIYKKPSAYKSGYIVKKYKELGGTYSDDDKPKNLERWYNEKWESVADKNLYPVYRPTKRINKDTPLTPNEINPANLKSQIALKQVIKGEHNLPKFEGKGFSNKEKEIKEYSNPTRVYQNAIKYLGPKVNIQLSTQPTKKYMVYNPIDDIWVHFGRMGYEDYTKHLNLERRHNYLVRSAGIKGDWKRDKYSANSLSRHILWEV